LKTLVKNAGLNEAKIESVEYVATLIYQRLYSVKSTMPHLYDILITMLLSVFSCRASLQGILFFLAGQGMLQVRKGFNVKPKMLMMSNNP
jgi:hypothetical protein